jgi:hypothetical protein
MKPINNNFYDIDINSWQESFRKLLGSVKDSVNAFEDSEASDFRNIQQIESSGITRLPYEKYKRRVEVLDIESLNFISFAQDNTQKFDLQSLNSMIDCLGGLLEKINNLYEVFNEEVVEVRANDQLASYIKRNKATFAHHFWIIERTRNALISLVESSYQKGCNFQPYVFADSNLKSA